MDFEVEKFLGMSIQEMSESVKLTNAPMIERI